MLENHRCPTALVTYLSLLRPERMLQLESTCSQVLHFSGAGAEEGNWCSEDKPSR